MKFYSARIAISIFCVVNSISDIGEKQHVCIHLYFNASTIKCRGVLLTIFASNFLAVSKRLVHVTLSKNMLEFNR